MAKNTKKNTNNKSFKANQSTQIKATKTLAKPRQTAKKHQKNNATKAKSNEIKSIRLNAYIAKHCPYSRRQADELIGQNRVQIERKNAKLGDIIKQGERVFIDNKLVREKRESHFSAIIYHKPKGELVSRIDSFGRKVIYDSLGEKFRHFVPVGRLDFASEGLIILSDSKAIVNALSASNLEREYILKIDSKISNKMLEAMQNGLSLKNAKAGGHKISKITAMDFAPFLDVQILKNTPKFSRLKVSINEGQNRELRRFFAHFEAKVLDLRRVRFGFVRLNALPVGKSRFFNRDEYKALKEFIGRKKQNLATINKTTQQRKQNEKL